jgi:hypothetical protein
LVVVLAVIGAVGLVVALTWQPRLPKGVATDAYRSIAALRQQAVEQGMVMTTTIADSTGTHPVTALPDGSVLTDATLSINRLTGRRVNVTR